MTKSKNPLAYFITFTCYGTWLHGDTKNSVDKTHNIIYTPQLAPHKLRNDYIKKTMIDPPYHLDARRRKIVLDSILTTCQYFNWKLFAAHVRSNHIHVVLNADVSPEIVLHRLKRYASSALNCANIDGARTKRWTRHGSTRYLWDERNVSVVMHYVVNLQGEPMAVHEDQV